MKNSTNSENKSQKKLLAEIEIEEINRELAKREFKEFITYTKPNYDWSWHLEELAWLVQGFITGESNDIVRELGIEDISAFDVLLLDFPPRHGKSEQLSIRLPAWYLGNFPEKEIITASYSGDLASTFGSKARDLMNSSDYKNIFDVRLREDTRAKDHWMTMQGGGYTATGIGGSVTGKGADLFVVDDPHKDRKEAESKVMRDAVGTFYTSVAETRMSPNGKKIVIQTRWHDDDLIGRILKKEKEDPESDRVLHITFPAIAKTDERKRSVGEALWPSRWPLDKLLKKKANIGSREFNALYQGDPVDDDSAYFKRKDFRYITEREVEQKQTFRILTIDSALTKKEDNCPTGFVDNRVDWENFWNLKAWRKWLSPKELLDEIFILHQLNRYDVIGVEETLFVIALKEFYEIEQRRRNIFLPLTYLKHNNQSKEVRARGVAPRYENHSVNHIVGQCNDLEEELVRWPSGEYKDLVDALAYQKEVAIAPGNPREEKLARMEDMNVKDPFGLFPDLSGSSTPVISGDDDLFDFIN